MLAELLYYLYPYQIFKSVVFRGSLTFLTTYLTINLVLPSIIRLFRQKGITADFQKTKAAQGPYSGATPIMGGIILVPAIVISVFLWAWINQFTIALLIIITSFALIGGLDDIAKVLTKRRIEAGKEARKAYSDKADGLRGDLRLVIEFIISFVVIGVIYWILDGINGQMYVPMIPMKNWFPELPTVLFIPIAMVIIVGGANAVNLTDGLDSLATVPIITCCVFIAGAAYLAGDAEWSERLKLLYISDQIKEVAIFAIAIIAACLAFLNFNSPPASIYMGDIGSLGMGAAVCAMFIFVKAELYLPIIGGTFVIAALSSIIQRLWFKIALWKKGRAWAEKNRFFYKAPYHHHQQSLLTYSEKQKGINSIWHNFLLKLGMGRVPVEDQYINPDYIRNKVIWKNHLRAVALLVISAMIYFKVR
ncbi:MAG: phospho-N-acetylmuramoyl-pentapeptide-transferase [SAR324 cluster bacterium]|nr:phospho-N-acetylmuramoyl-pentapeptide-transferase [SAR324 cluster bacterium]